MIKSSCMADSCGKPVLARGYCSSHYAKLRRTGELPTLTQLNRGECTIDGCDRPIEKKRMCNTHYIRTRRHGDPNALSVTKKPTNDARCTVSGCDQAWLSRGYCKRHYERFMKYGDPEGSAPRTTGCAVDECDRPHKGYGYCSAHLRRLKLYGDPEGSPPPWEPYACSVDGCTDERYALDLCRSHYWINSKYGDPLAVPQRAKKTHRLHPPRECETCGTMFDPGSGSRKRFCSRKCRPSYRKSSTYRGREVVIRLAERDGWECKLCSVMIDSSFCFPHPLSGSVDHIVPVSLGGSDSFDNLQLTHRRCNILKSNRAAAP